MAFRIHEDQENGSLAMRKDSDIFTANQRRALGDLSQFACNQNRNSKLAGLTNVTCKLQDENRTVRQIKNEKNIVPPVAQFRAFSVYEDKPSSEAEVKKREPTFKPFVAKETARKDNLFVNNNVENAKVLCAKEKLDRQKEAPPLRQPLQEKKDVVESPMSIGDSSILSMSISKNGSLLEEEDATTATNDRDMFFHVEEYRQDIYEYMREIEDATTATNDRDMFFHVEEYRQDIYEYMREIESKNRANPRYMRKQPDITHLMRSILVDWLVEVCDEYSQQSETLHLAVSYVDRFLSYMSVVRTKLQLVGTAATYIAAKYEEVYPPEVSEFVYITDDTYNKREVLRMEHLILKVLSFDLSTPTSLAFLSHYCISNGLSKKTFHLAAYIGELCLLEADPYLQYKQSIIAAGSLATARHCLLCERCASDNKESRETRDVKDSVHPSCEAVAWPLALEQCSGYSFADLEPVLRELARTHSHVAQQPYQAIPDKYKSNKFDGVSAIQARPMFPVSKYVAPAPAASAATRPQSAETRS